MVWRAAVGEAVVWRPSLIDDETYLIESVKTNLAGSEQRYKLTVDRDPNLFARRPSTRVYVRMEQTRPNRVRFKRLEKEFLMRLKAKLSELTPARTPKACRCCRPVTTFLPAPSRAHLPAWTRTSTLILKRAST